MFPSDLAEYLSQRAVDRPIDATLLGVRHVVIDCLGVDWEERCVVQVRLGLLRLRYMDDDGLIDLGIG